MDHVNEKLVPIWIRDYVEWKIDQKLGDKPPLTSRADSKIPERGESPSVLWIESLERKLQHIRIAVFAPEYLAQHQEFTDEDQALLIDEILALKERGQAVGRPIPDLAMSPNYQKVFWFESGCAAVPPGVY
jgi:hypothetical protein